MLTRRKTDRMVLLETRNGGKRIEDLILDGLKESRGEFQLAAANLGIPKGTFTKWLGMLDIEHQAQRIREHFGLKNTYVYKNIRTMMPQGSGGYTILDRIKDQCSVGTCRAYVEDLTGPLQVTSVVRYRDREESAVSITDKRGVRHEFTAYG